MTPTAGPKYPSTLSSHVGTYYSGLEQRIRTNLLPTLKQHFLDSLLPGSKVFELASGNGSHVITYADAFAEEEEKGENQDYPKPLRNKFQWTPSEADEFQQREVDATVDEYLRTKHYDKEDKVINKCVVLDVFEEDGWEFLRDKAQKEGKWQMVLASNCLHMIPFPKGFEAIMKNLPSLLEPKSPESPPPRFVVYGAFRPNEREYYSEGDRDFERMIQSRPGGSSFGLRPLDLLSKVATEALASSCSSPSPSPSPSPSSLAGSKSTTTAPRQQWKMEEPIPMAKGNWLISFVLV